MPTEIETSPDRRDRALIDILIVIAFSGAAYAIELTVADYLPWGDEARGIIAVLVGSISAVGLTLRHGGTLADLGFIGPNRWWTVPIWVPGIMFAFIIAQALVPKVLAAFFEVPEPDMSRYGCHPG